MIHNTLRIPHRRNAFHGVSLIEVLLGMLIIVIAAIGTLSYFSYGLGGINKQGNRRAALERARERLEQFMAASASQLPAQDGQLYYCSTGDPCAAWSAAPASQTTIVNDLAGMRMETTGQFIDDPSAGTETLDIFEFSAKVWFMPNSATDDDFHRVHLRTLRTPS